MTLESVTPLHSTPLQRSVRNDGSNKLLLLLVSVLTIPLRLYLTYIQFHLDAEKRN